MYETKFTLKSCFKREKFKTLPFMCMLLRCYGRHYMYRGSYMSAHVLLSLLSELGKRDEMQGSPSILFFFHNKFNKFYDTGA